MKEEDQDIEADRIDLIALFKEFREEKKLIVKFTLIFFFVGVFIAFFTKNEFTSSVTFIPLTNGESVDKNIGGLASLAGINIGGMSNNSEISPDLYPLIIKSIPFQMELLKTPINIKGQTSLITYREYCKNIHSGGVLEGLKKDIIGFPSRITTIFKSDTEKGKIFNNSKTDSIISISKEDDEYVKKIQDQINLDVKAEEGFVTLSVTIQEPIASAQITKRAQELLQEYILNFKTKKSTEELRFIEKRFSEKKEEYNTAKLKLARFKDRNHSINTSLSKTRLIELQGDYDLVFSVYSELAKQLETQRLKVKQDTPIFTILKPVVVPINKSAPKRLSNILIFVFSGFLLSLIYIKGKKYLAEIKNNL